MVECHEVSHYMANCPVLETNTPFCGWPESQSHDLINHNLNLISIFFCDGVESKKVLKTIVPCEDLKKLDEKTSNEISILTYLYQHF